MLTRIEIENFKSLHRADLALGALNLFVGTNASGKSNFFDALRVVQGIGYGFTIDEILNGKPKSASSEVWEPIRGGSGRVVFSPRGGEPPAMDAVVRIAVTLRLEEDEVRYAIGFSPARGGVRSETLSVNGNPLYDSTPVVNDPNAPVLTIRYYHGKTGRQPHLDFEKSRPVLHQLLRHEESARTHRELIERCVTALANMQRLDPAPAVLRDYSHAQFAQRMGERGENFAALVKTILQILPARIAYTSWLKQLTPAELDEVVILSGALGEPLFAIREAGADWPAPVLSDGTLRFAAITAAFFQPDLPDLLTIEEIENGVHPSRLRLLIELLRSQAQSSGRQVLATTHSPIVLAWLKPEDYPFTFFCKRDEESGASIIRRLNGIPNFLRIVEKQPIGELFAEGWLEGAL